MKKDQYIKVSKTLNTMKTNIKVNSKKMLKNSFY